uniref:RNA-dependent RNA polymerase n=1 Tax=Wenzhou bunya-like virus 1 TaxID=1923556 RepID=A0A1L3KPT8_9VIRU|nr:RNA-dependent RNA polymerase [Wenzhou bunya-like virus 1]
MGELAEQLVEESSTAIRMDMANCLSEMGKEFQRRCDGLIKPGGIEHVHQKFPEWSPSPQRRGLFHIPEFYEAKELIQTLGLKGTVKKTVQNKVGVLICRLSGHEVTIFPGAGMSRSEFGEAAYSDVHRKQIPMQICNMVANLCTARYSQTMDKEKAYKFLEISTRMLVKLGIKDEAADFESAAGEADKATDSLENLKAKFKKWVKVQGKATTIPEVLGELEKVMRRECDLETSLLRDPFARLWAYYTVLSLKKQDEWEPRNKLESGILEESKSAELSAINESKVVKIWSLHCKFIGQKLTTKIRCYQEKHGKEMDRNFLLETCGEMTELKEKMLSKRDDLKEKFKNTAYRTKLTPEQAEREDSLMKSLEKLESQFVESNEASARNFIALIGRGQPPCEAIRAMRFFSEGSKSPSEPIKFTMADLDMWMGAQEVLGGPNAVSVDAEVHWIMESLVDGNLAEELQNYYGDSGKESLQESLKQLKLDLVNCHFFRYLMKVGLISQAVLSKMPNGSGGQVKVVQVPGTDLCVMMPNRKYKPGGSWPAILVSTQDVMRSCPMNSKGLESFRTGRRSRKFHVNPAQLSFYAHAPMAVFLQALESQKYWDDDFQDPQGMRIKFLDYMSKMVMDNSQSTSSICGALVFLDQSVAACQIDPEQMVEKVFDKPLTTAGMCILSKLVPRLLQNASRNYGTWGTEPGLGGSPRIFTNPFTGEPSSYLSQVPWQNSDKYYQKNFNDRDQNAFKTTLGSYSDNGSILDQYNKARKDPRLVVDGVWVGNGLPASPTTVAESSDRMWRYIHENRKKGVICDMFTTVLAHKVLQQKVDSSVLKATSTVRSLTRDVDELSNTNNILAKGGRAVPQTARIQSALRKNLSLAEELIDAEVSEVRNAEGGLRSYDTAAKSGEKTTSKIPDKLVEEVFNDMILAELREEFGETDADKAIMAMIKEGTGRVGRKVPKEEVDECIKEVIQNKSKLKAGNKSSENTAEIIRDCLVGDISPAHFITRMQVLAVKKNLEKKLPTTTQEAKYKIKDTSSRLFQVASATNWLLTSSGFDGKSVGVIHKDATYNIKKDALIAAAMAGEKGEVRKVRSGEETRWYPERTDKAMALASLHANNPLGSLPWDRVKAQLEIGEGMLSLVTACLFVLLYNMYREPTSIQDLIDTRMPGCMIHDEFWVKAVAVIYILALQSDPRGWSGLYGSSTEVQLRLILACSLWVEDSFLTGINAIKGIIPVLYQSGGVKRHGLATSMDMFPSGDWRSSSVAKFVKLASIRRDIPEEQLTLIGECVRLLLSSEEYEIRVAPKRQRGGVRELTVSNTTAVVCNKAVEAVSRVLLKFVSTDLLSNPQRKGEMIKEINDEEELFKESVMERQEDANSSVVTVIRNEDHSKWGSKNSPVGLVLGLSSMNDCIEPDLGKVICMAGIKQHCRKRMMPNCVAEKASDITKIDPGMDVLTQSELDTASKVMSELIDIEKGVQPERYQEAHTWMKEDDPDQEPLVEPDGSIRIPAGMGQGILHANSSVNACAAAALEDRIAREAIRCTMRKHNLGSASAFSKIWMKTMGVNFQPLQLKEIQRNEVPGNEKGVVYIELPETDITKRSSDDSLGINKWAGFSVSAPRIEIEKILRVLNIIYTEVSITCRAVQGQIHSPKSIHTEEFAQIYSTYSFKGSNPYYSDKILFGSCGPLKSEKLEHTQREIMSSCNQMLRSGVGLPTIKMFHLLRSSQQTNSTKTRKDTGYYIGKNSLGLPKMSLPLCLGGILPCTYTTITGKSVSLEDRARIKSLSRTPAGKLLLKLGWVPEKVYSKEDAVKTMGWRRVEKKLMRSSQKDFNAYKDLKDDVKVNKETLRAKAGSDGNLEMVLDSSVECKEKTMISMAGNYRVITPKGQSSLAWEFKDNCHYAMTSPTVCLDKKVVETILKDLPTGRLHSLLNGLKEVTLKRPGPSPLMAEPVDQTSIQEVAEGETGQHYLASLSTVFNLMKHVVSEAIEIGEVGNEPRNRQELWLEGMPILDFARSVQLEGEKEERVRNGKVPIPSGQWKVKTIQAQRRTGKLLSNSVPDILYHMSKLDLGRQRNIKPNAIEEDIDTVFGVVGAVNFPLSLDDYSRISQLLKVLTPEYVSMRNDISLYSPVGQKVTTSRSGMMFCKYPGYAAVPIGEATDDIPDEDALPRWTSLPVMQDFLAIAWYERLHKQPATWTKIRAVDFLEEEEQHAVLQETGLSSAVFERMTMAEVVRRYYLSSKETDKASVMDLLIQNKTTKAVPFSKFNQRRSLRVQGHEFFDFTGGVRLLMDRDCKCSVILLGGATISEEHKEAIAAVLTSTPKSTPVAPLGISVNTNNVSTVLKKTERGESVSSILGVPTDAVIEGYLKIDPKRGTVTGVSQEADDKKQIWVTIFRCRRFVDSKFRAPVYTTEETGTIEMDLFLSAGVVRMRQTEDLGSVAKELREFARGLRKGGGLTRDEDMLLSRCQSYLRATTKFKVHPLISMPVYLRYIKQLKELIPETGSMFSVETVAEAVSDKSTSSQQEPERESWDEQISLDANRIYEWIKESVEREMPEWIYEAQEPTVKPPKEDASTAPQLLLACLTHGERGGGFSLLASTRSMADVKALLRLPANQRPLGTKKESDEIMVFSEDDQPMDRLERAVNTPEVMLGLSGDIEITLQPCLLAGEDDVDEQDELLPTDDVSSLAARAPSIKTTISSFREAFDFGWGASDFDDGTVDELDLGASAGDFAPVSPELIIVRPREIYPEIDEDKVFVYPFRAVSEINVLELGDPRLEDEELIKVETNKLESFSYFVAGKVKSGFLDTHSVRNFPVNWWEYLAPFCKTGKDVKVIVSGQKRPVELDEALDNLATEQLSSSIEDLQRRAQALRMQIAEVKVAETLLKQTKSGSTKKREGRGMKFARKGKQNDDSPKSRSGRDSGQARKLADELEAEESSIMDQIEIETAELQRFKRSLLAAPTAPVRIAICYSLLHRRMNETGVQVASKLKSTVDLLRYDDTLYLAQVCTLDELVRLLDAPLELVCRFETALNQVILKSCGEDGSWAVNSAGALAALTGHAFDITGPMKVV